MGSRLQAEKGYAEARPWYEKAAAQNHALATNNLAYFYDLGLGVPQDRAKGFELYSRAEDSGWAEAMFNVAVLYGAGQVGSKPDLPNACIWNARAERYASPDDPRTKQMTARTKAFLTRSMSSSELTTCQEQADAWKPPRLEGAR